MIIVVPAQSGRAVRAGRGDLVTVTDVQGGQVGDLWAIDAADQGRWLSAGHTRDRCERLFPAIGEDFRDQHGHPILRLASDTSPGVHDMLFPACDPAMYAARGLPGHPNCRDNFLASAARAGLAPPLVPDPVNLFQNSGPQPDGKLVIGAATSRPGDAISFLALREVIVIVTSCAVDYPPLSDGQCTPLRIQVARHARSGRAPGDASCSLACRDAFAATGHPGAGMAEPRYQQYRASAATRITPDNWAAVRAAVKDVGDRFAAMVLSAPDPGAMATADWTIMDTAAHVTGIAWTYTARVVSDDIALPIPAIADDLLTTTVYNIHAGINTALFHGYPQRDPREVAGRLSTSIDEVLDLTAAADPARTAIWLGGSNLPVAGLLAHLLNELLIHGRDIARCLGAPWPIAQEHSALFIELFLVEIIRNGVGAVLDDGKPPRPGRIAVEFRSAYTRPVTIVLDNGVVSVEEPSRDNDVRLYFQPAPLCLMLFHRVGMPTTAMTGAVRVWGRRPWLLPPFLRKVRLP